MRSTFEKRGDTFWRGGKLRGIQTERECYFAPFQRSARQILESYRITNGIAEVMYQQLNEKEKNIRERKGKECR